MIRHEHRNFCILYLSELGRHQLIKLGIAGELVDKRHKRAADLEKPLSCADIRDIDDLKVGNIKKLAKSTVFVTHYCNTRKIRLQEF